MTLRDLIYRALRLVQRVESGEYTSSPELESEVIIALQSLVANWSARHSLQPFTIIDSFLTEPNKYYYTIGFQDQYNPSDEPDIESKEPEYIKDMYYSLNTDVDLPINQISESDYFKICRKNIQTGLGPQLFYYKYSIPYGIIYFWPPPSISYQVTMSSYKVPSWIDVTNLDIDIPLPTPYIEALTYNLAVAISPEGNTEPSQDVYNKANESLNNILMFTRKTTSIAKIDIGRSPYRRWWRGYNYW